MDHFAKTQAQRARAKLARAMRIERMKRADTDARRFGRWHAVVDMRPDRPITAAIECHIGRVHVIEYVHVADMVQSC